MKTKLKQIYYDMRHQPVIAWVTFFATAMSVFLIMVIIMMQNVKSAPFAPESCRDRLLLGVNLHVEDIEDQDINSSSSLSSVAARVLYDDIDGVEKISYYHKWMDDSEVSVPGGESCMAQLRKADAAFFNIFDYTLIEGRYYTTEEADALMPLAVITETVARNVLGDAPWTGRDIVIDDRQYTVVGVVRDISSLAMTAYADLFVPTALSDTEGDRDNLLGQFGAVMVVKEGVDFSHIRQQVKARYSTLDAMLAQSGMRAVYHEGPYEQEVISNDDLYSNVTPDLTSAKRMHLIIYAILLLVPAVNLSSMLHSRLSRRIREIGIRRAFGCTRKRIIADVIIENFIVTLLGGAVGVVTGVIFAATYSGLYNDYENFRYGDTPVMGALLNWQTVGVALLVCFILNIFSAALPAWYASSLKPVEALNSK